jgi:ubiquinone/menaquinone biosynthesis C-methylase UbiE
MAKKGIDKKKYDRMAKIYDLMESPMELLSFARWRSKAIDRAYTAQKILEVGSGTGKNLPYYNENQQVFAVDISKKMLKKAKVRVEKSKAIVNLVQMDVESLGFPSYSFDEVVATYVFCSVENPISGLHELRRVLKKDGVAVFLEHTRSENELIGKGMDLFNPVVSRMGPNINRRTVRNIRDAGFEVIEEVHLFSSVFRLIVAQPKPE